MLLPEKLRTVARYETGKSWLEKLPGIVRQVSQQWDLTLGKPFEDSHISLVVPVRWKHGNAILKIQWPHEECRYEAEALRKWNGDGAVRLLAHDAERHALLLERCSPGLPLGKAGNADPVSILAGLVSRLWIPAGPPFKSLQEEAAGWAAALIPDWEKAGRPCEIRLVETAADLLATLPASQGEQVLLHQDLHGDNVLSAKREPWLVIDPKPLVGEREFGAAPIVRSFEFGHSRQAVLYRLDRLCGELGLDRERVRGWTIAQTMAWSFDSNHSQRHFETVRWLLDG